VLSEYRWLSWAALQRPMPRLSWQKDGEEGQTQACSVKMKAPSLHEATTFSDKTGG